MVFECELYPPIVDYLKNNGYDYYEEIKFLTRYIDLLAHKKKKLVAIEVKVSNWQKALQQALACRLCAHESYIALSEKFIHRVQLDILKEYGIGLIAVKENSIEIIQKPKKSKIIHKSVKKEVLEQIEKGLNIES
jgi:hypothetical protein